MRKALGMHDREQGEDRVMGQRWNGRVRDGAAYFGVNAPVQDVDDEGDEKRHPNLAYQFFRDPEASACERDERSAKRASRRVDGDVRGAQPARRRASGPTRQQAIRTLERELEVVRWVNVPWGGGDLALNLERRHCAQARAIDALRLGLGLRRPKQSRIHPCCTPLMPQEAILTLEEIVDCLACTLRKLQDRGDARGYGQRVYAARWALSALRERIGMSRNRTMSVSIRGEWMSCAWPGPAEIAGSIEPKVLVAAK